MKGIRGPYPVFSQETSHLPYPALQRLMGHLLLDPAFGDRFVNGGRVEILAWADFLSAQERSLLLSIQADTPHELAQAILERCQADRVGEHSG